MLQKVSCPPSCAAGMSHSYAGRPGWGERSPPALPGVQCSLCCCLSRSNLFLLISGGAGWAQQRLQSPSRRWGGTRRGPDARHELLLLLLLLLRSRYFSSGFHLPCVCCHAEQQEQMLSALQGVLRAWGARGRAARASPRPATVTPCVEKPLRGFPSPPCSPPAPLRFSWGWVQPVSAHRASPAALNPSPSALGSLWSC